jgi:hypothetical protein
MIRSSLFALLFFTATAFAEQTLVDLSWLEGTWRLSNESFVYQNHFSTDWGGIRMGYSKMTSADGNKLFFYEFDSIQFKDGVLTLQPSPNGTPGVSFLATEIADQKVVFENPNNDYPTRITYSINDKGQLTLLVEGKDKSKNNTFVMDKE